MINLDLSNVWGELSLPDLLAAEQEVSSAHQTLASGKGEGGDFTGWLDLPTVDETEEVQRIRTAAQRIRESSDVLVVVGIGGSYRGPGPGSSCCAASTTICRGRPRSFLRAIPSPRAPGRSCASCWRARIFPSTLFPNPAQQQSPPSLTRALKWMLERKYGTEKARTRVYVTTDPRKGALHQMAEEEGWERFVIPPNVGGRYSVLTAVGLLPMAVAGIDIDGAAAGRGVGKDRPGYPFV